ncbi:hypothetical protein ABPG74_007506 [Tetrahymena malaccensis]
MSRVIKEPEFFQSDSNRSSVITNQRVSNLNDLLIRARIISFNSNNRLSNMSQISQLDFEQYYQNIDLNLIIKIQSYGKMILQRKKYIKMLQKAKYRLQVIRELVCTEENYVQKLQQLRDVVYIPLLNQSKPIDQRKDIKENQMLQQQTYQLLQDVQIKQSDVENIFANLEAIIELNSKFAEEMKRRKENLQYNGVFTDVCVQYAPQLKIYVTYLNNYENSTKILNSLKLNNLNFKKFCNHLENWDLNGYDLQDFLIKPVQRLPKYLLLLKDLFKNTLPSHPDYIHVQTAINEFNEVCSHNNEQMDKFIRDNRLIELHRKFCLPFQQSVEQNNSSNSSLNQSQVKNTPKQSQQNLLERSKKSIFLQPLKQPLFNANANGELQLIQAGVNREFLWEENLFLVQGDTQRQVTVYFLNDVILVSVKENQERESLIKYLPLNEQSSYKNMPDQKYLSNLFRIIGKNDSLTFVCENDDSKTQLINKINYQIIRPLRLKAKQKIKERIPEQNNQVKQNQTIEELKNSVSQISDGQKVEDDQSKQNLEQDSNNNRSYSDKSPVKLDVYDDYQFPIVVTVLGTEERNSSNQMKETYTVYIAQIQIGESIKQKIFVRYSEMIELKKFIEKYIKEITDLEKLPKVFIFHHKTKIIEKRKILIENFLQKILSSQCLKNHIFCSYILSQLGLPNNFYQLPLNIGESNFDFLNDMDKEENTSKLVLQNSQSNNIEEDSQNEEDSFNYENGNEEENDMNRSNKNQQRQISVGASSFYQPKTYLAMKQKLQCSNDLSQISQSNGQEDGDQNNLSKINESQDLSNSQTKQFNSSGIRQAQSVNSSCIYMNDSTNSSIQYADKSQNISVNQVNTSQILNSSLLYEEKEIEIFTLDNKGYKININRSTKALDVCEILAKKLQLVSFLDFRLYIEDEKKKIRFLDDDEIIFKLIFKDEFKKNELDIKRDKESSKKKILDFGESILNKLGLKHNHKYKLKFCKYMWLEKDLEEFDYKSDPVRLQLMASQILNDISQMKYLFSDKDYFLYSSLYLFINHPEVIQSAKKDGASKQVKSTIYSKIKEFLPNEIIKQNKENVWVENLLIYIETFSNAIAESIKTNKQMIRESVNFQDNQNQSSSDEINATVKSFQAQSQNGDQNQETSPSNQNTQNNFLQNQTRNSSIQGIGHLQQISTSIITNKKNMACMVLLDTFKKTPLYGATLFQCETYSKTIKESKKQIPQNVFICVKCDSIQILDSSKQKKKQFTFQEIKGTRVFPSSITFILRNESIPYRFDTNQSFEISQLITAYQSILVDIEKNAMTLDEESNKFKIQNQI